MEVTIRTTKLRKLLGSDKELKKNYGDKMVRKIEARITVLEDEPNLESVSPKRPERRHQLDGKRKGQFAVDLDGGYRLVFEPNHEPLPRKRDGGIDLTRVTKITIIEIVDYH